MMYSVDYAGRCLTLMIQFADNESTYLVFNNSLHKTNNKKTQCSVKKMIQKFIKFDN